MYYNYHARNLQRIADGELIGIEPSENKEFAFVLVFNTYPTTRPIRHHATWRYEQIIGEILIKESKQAIKKIAGQNPIIKEYPELTYNSWLNGMEIKNGKEET